MVTEERGLCMNKRNMKFMMPLCIDVFHSLPSSQINSVKSAHLRDSVRVMATSMDLWAAKATID